MRVCSPQLGINPQSVLGGEVFDREILLGLAKEGIKIEIILPKGKPHDKNIKNWEINYIPLTHFPAVFFNLLIIPYLFLIFRMSQFKIIRIHSPKFIGIGAIFFKLFNREVKLVATFHQFSETRIFGLGPFVNRFWDHIICDSQYVKNKIIQIYNLPKEKISFVHNGVPSYLRPSPKDKKLLKKLELKGKIVLLFMGLFIPRKTPLFLLDVLSKLSKTRSDIVLVLWGTGPLKSKILRKAKNLGLAKKIRILNPVFGEEKNKIHNLADIFVHPSEDEGFALAPLEAMACAKPIVITDGYSAREAVEDGINGFSCRQNDLKNWVEKIAELIKNSRLRDKMGRASLEKVKAEFQWKFAIEQHLEVFQKLI